MTVEFEPLFRTLGDQLARALVSRFSPASDDLRRHLVARFSQPPGSETGLLSSPIFEATFGFESASVTLGDLSPGLLHPSLVDALDAPSEERFPRDRRPFHHQLEAWHALLRDRRSTLVSSGTGSGKTECFLVPILDDLARAVATQTEPLTGVQAIFLYPLNALIASQRERLDAWTRPFRGKIRYCLYNGLTPEEVQARVAAARPWEVADRKTLREDPPPILVTNATMLEYMLVRQQDHPIISASRGRLRWFVLDEAHTYIGSQAAELALLLRRVRAAFDVAPEDIRLVATSATLGDDRAGALRDFLASLAGVSVDQICLIRGQRVVPPLALEPGPLRTIRETLGTRASSLDELCDAVSKERGEAMRPEEVLRVIDEAHPRVEPVPHLPVRAHAFVRSLPGLWACVNAGCSGRDGAHAPLPEATGWTFGKIFDARRLHCDACESLVLPLVRCTSCGADYLLGERHIDSNGRVLKAPRHQAASDMVAIEHDDDEQEAGDGSDAGRPPAAADSTPHLIGRWASSGEPPITIDRQTGEESPAEPARAIHLTLLPRVPGPEGGVVLACGRCGRAENPTRFVPFASSRPFTLETALPLALERMPPAAPLPDQKREERPLAGRRLLTFTDSRQGSARFALLLGLAGERRFAESWLFHHLWSRQAGGENPARVAELQQQIVALEVAITSTSSGGVGPLRSVLEGAQRELANLTSPPPPSIAFKDAVEALASEAEVQHLTRQWKAEGRRIGTAYDVARFMLMRMWLQRPRRRLSPETTGLMALRFPALERLPLPDVWREAGASEGDWRDALALAMDRVRGMNAVNLAPDHALWLGFTWHPATVVGPDEPGNGRNVRSFFSRGDRGLRQGFGPLIARRFGLNRDDRDDHRRLIALMEALWDGLRRALTPNASGSFYVALAEQAEIVAPAQIWRCPITLRALPRVLGGFTPYAAPQFSDEACLAQPLEGVVFPSHLAFVHSVTQRAELEAWLTEDWRVAALRDAGLWTDLCDGVVRRSGYFRAAEHSAQIHRKQLERLEADFKKGKLNILSCSTTMEMGIDIGGMSMVAMNNVPPAPANYLQRAGRAGRRGETASLSLTVCRPQPHDAAIFHAPTWPFRTPIAVPAVALNSRPIVTRHLHAFALTRFLNTQAESTTTPIRLRASEVFESSGQQPALASQLIAWLRGSACQDEGFVAALPALLFETALAGVSTEALLHGAAERLAEVVAEWQAEVRAIEAELAAIGSADAAARTATEKKLARMRQEFALKELAIRGWLPSYGFPHQVVPLVITHRKTREEEAGGTSDRNDDTSTWRDFPTRSIDIALREYAPGASVVIGGRVYTSGGVTLNWQRPPQREHEIREIQSLRWAFRCRSCGLIGDRAARVESCPSCGDSAPMVSRYLRPAGFAVDFMEEPHNNLEVGTFGPTDDPWVSSGEATWQDKGRWMRVRSSHDGIVHYQNRSPSGGGFDICFRCGAAKASLPRPGAGGDEIGELAQSSLDGHHPLRFRKKDRGADSTICHGNSESFAIQRGLALGATLNTDVFELQVRAPAGGGPGDEATRRVTEAQATSLAVAMKQGLASLLGIDRRELGFHVSFLPWRDDKAPVIALFDTAPGGAGYASQAVSNVQGLLRETRRVLECPSGCDAACHACLLSFETDRVADKLDRRAAIELLGLLGIGGVS